MKIKIGDYFDLYQEGKSTRRVIAITHSRRNVFTENFCEAIDLEFDSDSNFDIYHVDADSEIEKVIGNIFE